MSDERSIQLAKKYLDAPVLTADGLAWIRNVEIAYEAFVSEYADNESLWDRSPNDHMLVLAAKQIPEDPSTVWDIYHGISAWSTNVNITDAVSELQESNDPTYFGKVVLQKIALWMLLNLWLSEGEVL